MVSLESECCGGGSFEGCLCRVVGLEAGASCGVRWKVGICQSDLTVKCVDGVTSAVLPPVWEGFCGGTGSLPTSCWLQERQPGGNII